MIVKLTPEELAGRAERMAALELRYNEQKADAEAIAAITRQELKSMRTEITKLAREIDAGEVETIKQLEIIAEDADSATVVLAPQYETEDDYRERTAGETGAHEWDEAEAVEEDTDL